MIIYKQNSLLYIVYIIENVSFCCSKCNTNDKEMKFIMFSPFSPVALFLAGSRRDPQPDIISLTYFFLRQSIIVYNILIHHHSSEYKSSGITLGRGVFDKSSEITLGRGVFDHRSRDLFSPLSPPSLPSL